MDYKNHYAKLMAKAAGRLLTEYCESHHIVPRCMGGTDDPANLAKLTPEEHYLAHQLLVKIHPGNPKLASAAMMMCSKRKGNKVYGWLRRRHAAAMSLHQAGEKNSQFGTVWIYKDSQVQKVNKEVVDEYITNGWKLGRKEKSVRVKKNNPTGLDTDKYKWVLENQEDILEEFDKFRSVSRILRVRGFQNREGNKILSRWLKSKGRTVLRRRNTAGLA
jgi:hypothetical protein